MISKDHSSTQWMKDLCVGMMLILMSALSACASKAQINLDGQAIFNANCSSCHTIGRGSLTGPDLKGVTAQQTQDWLVNFISNPDGVITSGDPTARQLLIQNNYVVMPNMGLTKDQVLAVLAYIQAESGLVVSTPVGTPGAVLAEGNAENGKAIFLGDVHMKNGGPFCIGCHKVNNTSLLGGGTLGPDLTNAYTKYGDVGLEGILSNLPFLTMRPIFSNHTPTESERADLRAFLKESAGKPETNKEPLIIAISLVGFLVLLVLITIIWRNRLQGVRRQLVDQARSEK